MDFFYTKIENSGPATARIGIKGHAPLSQFLNSSFILQFRMSKVFKLIIDDGNEPIILEEDEVLEDILNHLESISNRIDDIQFSLMKKRR